MVLADRLQQHELNLRKSSFDILNQGSYQIEYLHKGEHTSRESLRVLEGQTIKNFLKMKDFIMILLIINWKVYNIPFTCTFKNNYIQAYIQYIYITNRYTILNIYRILIWIHREYTNIYIHIYSAI